MSDESLDLAEVQAAFRDAQRRFEELAEATQELESVSIQLEGARAVIAEAGSKLGSLAEASTSVSGQLAEATRAIEAINPAEISEQLNSLGENVSQMGDAIESSEQAHRARQRVQLVFNVAVLFAIAAVVVLLLTG